MASETRGGSRCDESRRLVSRCAAMRPRRTRPPSGNPSARPKPGGASPSHRSLDSLVVFVSFVALSTRSWDSIEPSRPSFQRRPTMTTRTPFSRALQHAAMALSSRGRCGAAVGAAGAGPTPARVKYAQVDPEEIKEWLTYLASDAAAGTAGVHRGLRARRGVHRRAARAWGVKPLGDDGTYLQTVRLRGYRSTRNSSVTVDNGADDARSSTAIT